MPRDHAQDMDPQSHTRIVQDSSIRINRIRHRGVQTSPSPEFRSPMACESLSPRLRRRKSSARGLVVHQEASPRSVKVQHRIWSTSQTDIPES